MLRPSSVFCPRWSPSARATRAPWWARCAAWSGLLALCTLGLGCAAGARRGPVTLHPQYRPPLAAVQDALEHDRLELAERTLMQWRARLQFDRGLASDTAPGDAVRAARGDDLGRPNLAAIADAERTVESYERIIEGRRVVAALTLDLQLRRVPETAVVEVLLRVESALVDEVVLAPGPGSLSVHRLSVEPRTGHESRGIEVVSVADVKPLTVPPRGAVELRLTDLTVSVPTGAIATRMRCELVLRSGEVRIQGRQLPVRALAVAPVERTDLPSWLPATAVEPTELARLAAQLGATPEALVERAVRILPSRRVEALELLREPVAARGPEQLATLVPALRWLAGVEGFGRDPLEWRAYMQDAPWRTAKSNASH